MTLNGILISIGVKAALVGLVVWGVVSFVSAVRADINQAMDRPVILAANVAASGR